MIVTCKKSVPKFWIVLAILPWASFTFNGGVVGTAFLFSLQKFIDNPAGLTFILSLPGILGIIVSPVASFLSDRIWTRYGRRKPFIIIAWVGMLAGMALMPLMPNLWFLIASYLLYQCGFALGAPIEALKQEIIPPQERGWATGAMSWVSNLATLIFYFVMLGRFDDVTYLAGIRLEGEWVIYWSASLFLAIMLFIIILGIKEVNPKSALRGERLSIRHVLGDLVSRELWPVYLLVFGNSCLNFYSGLGALSNLLYTVQWGYTKQEMGVNVAIGGVLNLFVIGFLTMIADRLNRMRAYQTVLMLLLLANVSYYGYVEYLLPDKRPTLVEIIIFGESISILSILMGMLYIPLVYDYVRRDLMGTFGAGGTIVGRITTLITLNGVGLFVTLYAHLYQPPAGDMTRVVLREPVTRTRLIASLDRPQWSVSNWAATGVIESHGRTWEIRQSDTASEALAAEKEKLTAENSRLITKKATTGSEEKRRTYQQRIDAISKRLAEIDASQAVAAKAFRQQVVQVLGNRLLDDDGQLLSATERPAIQIQLEANYRPDPQELDQFVETLQRRDPDFIDLRPAAAQSRHGCNLIASALLPATGDETDAVARIQSEVGAAVAQRAPDLLRRGSPATHWDVHALMLNLMTVEEPVPSYVSPVTRAVNAVLGLFGHEPDPFQHLTALASALRIPGQSSAVRVAPGPRPRSISVTAVLAPGAALSPTLDDPIGRKLSAALGPDAARARSFYDRVRTAATARHLTIAQPILASGYAPMKYDYMSGYLWMFVMGSIGVLLTFYFQRLEKAGVIYKRGVEEALAA
ncbi:MAG TPA: MFS transporter [Chthoniobacteraceae bacterium]|jgi:Na+/melibiose symporter-like transporter|nr:MFS transporter [Chthoniobacteraceae bacterium]